MPQRWSWLRWKWFTSELRSPNHRFGERFMLNHEFRRAWDPEPLVIGLVNNMPSAEFSTTEGQFRRLLSAASPHGVEVRLRFFALSDVPRREASRQDLLERYEDVSRLEDGQLDGMIVSGTEPRAASLRDEPYWPALTRLVEWAEDHTKSTIWSCLAGHAAVLHLDGIKRQPFARKLSGVFDSVTTTSHPILTGVPRLCPAPHSRYNGLPEAELVAHGYEILTSSPATGPDMVARQGRSLFLFMQGHPEYDAGALLREYRRDVGRFVGGRTDRYPEIPQGYLNPLTADLLASFRERATERRDPRLLDSFPAVLDSEMAHRWREPAVEIYRGWLEYLLLQKDFTARAFRDQPLHRCPA